MNKQRMIILVLFAIILSFTISGEEKANKTSDSEILLRGELESGGFRSGGDVVTAEMQGNVIMALFHKDVGNLLVTLTNSTGEQVYEILVNTSVYQQALIPISGLPAGVYSITFSNGLGTMYGDFEI
ncbi:MAG: hypothetical protein PWQ06_2275 [Anaerophaga sp.]|jgi:hypothetical protein|nr:hypothetical protein [Anaerophaga sp.]